MTTAESLPWVLADQADEQVREFLDGQVRWVAWDESNREILDRVTGIYTYGHPTVDGRLMDRVPGVRVISNYGVGVDHIDLDAARERQLPVGNTPGILDGATADQAWTLLLAAARRLVVGDHFARGEGFDRYDPSRLWGTEVHGSRLGIIGMGRIGREIAKRAVGFSMELLYHNRNPLGPGIESYGAVWVELDELLKRSDFVVLACPLTEATRNLIGAGELGLMPAHAILVNIARGGVVDTEALTVALETGQIAAAGLDVTEPEPLPRDHRLLRLEQVTIAPHLGSATSRTRRLMAMRSAENLLLGLRGEPLWHRIV
ncbi:MAG: D-glycerate dehydrogenase [Planctomycetales bacterium]|nr:D-glycerate dehydrogenase [Planctomycetales bacterium]